MTLAEPGSVPGSAERRSGDRDDDGLGGVGSHSAEERHPVPAVQDVRRPCRPPADPAGAPPRPGTGAAGRPRSRRRGPRRRCAARRRRRPGRRSRGGSPRRSRGCAGTSGVTRLTTPCSVPSASPADSGLERARARGRVRRVEGRELGQRSAARQGRHRGRRRQGRQVDDREAYDPAGRRHEADLAAGPSWSRRRRPRRARPADPRSGSGSALGGPREQPGRGQQHVARVVGDLERRR